MNELLVKQLANQYRGNARGQPQTFHEHKRCKKNGLDGCTVASSQIFFYCVGHGYVLEHITPHNVEYFREAGNTVVCG